MFAFAHHAWAREAKRGDETGNGSNCGSIENGTIENGSSASSGSGGDEGYGDDQVTNLFYVMASGGLYSSIYITIHSLINYLCALDTTLRLLDT